MLFHERARPELEEKDAEKLQEEELESAEGGGHGADIDRNRAPDPGPRGRGGPAEPPGEQPNRSPGSKTPDSRRTRAAENDYTTIFGHKGHGKTTLARAIWRARMRAGGSGVWIDATGRNGDLGAVVTTAAELARSMERSLEAGRPFSLVVQPGWDPDLSRVWRLLYDVGGLLLVLDDCQPFADAHRIDSDLELLVAWGRNSEVDLVTTARTPPEVHGSIKGQTDVAVTFRQTKRRYAEVLEREFFHLDGAAGRIMALPRFHYLRVQDGEVSYGKVKPGA